MRKLLLGAVLVLSALTVSAQSKVTVSGVVVDEENLPMIGVSVLEAGTTNGVVTDIDGKYTLNVTKGATVQVVSLGFKTYEFVAAEGTFNIVLELDKQVLDEVVVVGYGVQKKSDLTGAISSVKDEDILNRPITSAAQALQGKTAGVQVISSSARPGASPSIRIRGISSNGASDPLYVVDGRIASDISGLDPNDIESMEVLKDAASAAIYGAQAGNGVILVTTRKGAGKGQISYDFQITTQSLANVPKVMNAEQYADYYLEANYFSIDKIYRGWDQKTNTDWAKAAFENSIMHRHNLTFSAGSDKASIYASMSYLGNNGIVAGDADTYQRITGMINASWKIKPWLELGTNNQLEHYTSRAVTEGSEYASLLLSVLQLDPLTPVTYSPDNLPSNMKAVLANPDAYGELLKDSKGNYYGVPQFSGGLAENPFIMRDSNYSQTKGFNINGTTYLNLMPIKGLTITTRLSYLFNSSRNYGYTKPYYGNEQVHSNFVSLNSGSSQSVYFQWENFINYTHTFKSGHTIGAMIGMSYSQNVYFGVNGSKQGSYQDGVLDLGVKQNDPNFYYFAYATPTATSTVSGGEESYSRKNSYFGRINYDYKGRYLIQASLRADACDTAILPANNRWGFFPAVSAGWVISNENWMKNAHKVINHLKLRASWGQNGSVAVLGGYAYKNVIVSSGSYPTGSGMEYMPAYGPSSTGNNELKWETAEQFNIGLDARFLRDRLSFSIDYYDKTTRDLIVTGITPSTVVGVTASPVNAGTIKNNGVEIELGWQDYVGDFSYSIRGNVSTIANKVTYIHPTINAIDGATFHTYGAITRFQKDMPAWYFYGYKFSGINETTGDPEFVDVDKDGQITDNDKTYLGKGFADVNYGITINLAWKGLSLNVFGTGAAGNDIYCCLNRQDYPVNKLTYFTEDRWTPTHTKATMPRAGASNLDKYYVSSASVFDGSYFKIKQIQLGYAFPQKWMSKIHVDHLRIYVSLDDFFTFTKYPGFDPEVVGAGNSLGVDKGSYPNSKKIVAGLTLRF